jgi:hypothetical protein
MIKNGESKGIGEEDILCYFEGIIPAFSWRD